MNAGDQQYDSGKDSRGHGYEEIDLRTLRNDVLRPGKQRSDAVSSSRNRPMEKIDAVIERRADGHLASLKYSDNHGKSVPQRMQKHATSKNQISEKEAGLARCDRFEGGFSAFRWSRWRR